MRTSWGTQRSHMHPDHTHTSRSRIHPDHTKKRKSSGTQRLVGAHVGLLADWSDLESTHTATRALRAAPHFLTEEFCVATTTAHTSASNNSAPHFSSQMNEIHARCSVQGVHPCGKSADSGTTGLFQFPKTTLHIIQTRPRKSILVLRG